MVPASLGSAYTMLSLQERAAALDAAFELGRRAAAGPVDPADLQAPRPIEYFIHVVSPLIDAGVIGEKSAAGWKLQCLDHRALEDPRVQAFLHGWHRRAAEILLDIEQSDTYEGSELSRLLEDHQTGSS